MPATQGHYWFQNIEDKRLVVTGYEGMSNQVPILNVGADEGLSVDKRFHSGPADEPGIRFDQKRWAHGGTGPAVPHGAVFSIP